jgi:hypothetical protein
MHVAGGGKETFFALNWKCFSLCHRLL